MYGRETTDYIGKPVKKNRVPDKYLKYNSVLVVFHLSLRAPPYQFHCGPWSRHHCSDGIDLIYLEIIISVLAAVACLAVCIYALFSKTRSAAGLIVSAAAFVSALIFILMGIHLADGSLIEQIAEKKAHLSLLIIVSVLFMVFAVSYPYLKPWRSAMAAVLSLPGCALAIITLTTDLTVSTAAGAGEAYTPYLAILSFYLISAPVLTVYKSLLNENRAIKIDLRYISAGMILSFSSLMALTVLLPGFFGIDRFIITGTALSLLPALVMLAYGASDVNNADMRRLFRTALYWLIVSAILILPVSLLLKYNTVHYIDEPLPLPGVALFIFAYLFLIFKYLRPRIENVFQKGYRDLVARVDQLFERQFMAGPGEKQSWEEFQKTLVDGIVDQFGISGAYLFLYRPGENRFMRAHGSDDKITDRELSSADPLSMMLDREHRIIYCHALAFTNRKLEGLEQLEPILEFFIRNGIDLVLPFYNHDGRIIGLLALGRLWRNVVYSRELISVLELYRIRFQQHLANALVMEDARATQVLDHDRLVVSTVKNKIIPKKLAHAAGYRISSLYLDNSPFGGDYFDSIPDSDTEMLLFMADSSYYGVDSALLLLELYTVLHMPGKKTHTPDTLLETMNWIIATSRFANTFAPAFCAALASSGEMTYSSAGFNPMLVYDQTSGQFTPLDTPGVPLGSERTSNYELRTARLTPGAIGLLYSKGLPSAVNPAGTTYNIDRLTEIVRTGRSRSPADLTRLVFEDLNRFTEGKRQTADISVVIYKLQ